MRRSGLPGLLGLLLLLPWAASADVHPNTESGVAVDRAFQSGEVDHVNLFNGSLSLVIPLGVAYPVASTLSYRFTLVYNSNPWIYATDTPPNGTGTFTYSQPSPCSNAGLGWRLSFGAVGPSTCLSTDETSAATAKYEAPDGSQHLFYANLHPGEPVDPNYLYTRDGSYLRMHFLGPAGSEIEFPDGTVHAFNPGGTIQQMRDRFGNQVSFSYSADSKVCSGAPSCWKITDTQNRTHWVYFGAQGMIDHVDLAAFGTQRASYTFSYTTATVGRSCPSNDIPYGDLPVNLLVSVTLL